ncbi:MAG: hypothetical protein ACRC8Y_06115, partial [Chroococcales cyanobacterium]
MRDLSNWGKQVRKALRESDDLKSYVSDIQTGADSQSQKREVERLAQLITEVELGLTLLKDISPEEAAKAVSALLSGYRFPIATLQDDDNWRRVQTARFYLVRRKGNQWERSLNEYIKIPEILRIYSLTEINEPPQL